MRQQCNIVLTFIALTIVAFPQTVSYAKAVSAKDLSIYSTIQINFLYEYPSVLLTNEELQRFLYIEHSYIFPGIGLTGTFKMINRTNDTLIIANENSFLLDYVSLQHYVDEERSGESVVIPAIFKEVVKSYSDTLLPTFGKKNYLPPHDVFQVDFSCSWNDLSKLQQGVTHFRLVFDNSDIATGDTSIICIKYNSPNYDFFTHAKLEYKIDTLFSMYVQARNQNYSGEFNDALMTCKNMLELDSTNYGAYRIATDVLWKLNLFAESIEYAQKGIQIIQSATRDKILNNWRDEAGYFIDVLQNFIDKCQRREKWKWAK